MLLAGPCFDPGYLEICKFMDAGHAVYLGPITRDMVASAMKACRVHVLPSLSEGSALVNMEAAASACPMVVANRSSEREYFGDAPFYCDPLDQASIRTAVERAWRAADEQSRWGKLAQLMREEFTWDRTAEVSERTYHHLLARALSTC